MEFYFYKGFRISQQNGVFVVIAPSIGGKIVHICKRGETKIHAKLWIETADDKIMLLREARRIAELLK